MNLPYILFISSLLDGIIDDENQFKAEDLKKVVAEFESASQGIHNDTKFRVDNYNNTSIAGENSTSKPLYISSYYENEDDILNDKYNFSDEILRYAIFLGRSYQNEKNGRQICSSTFKKCPMSFSEFAVLMNRKFYPCKYVSLNS